MLLFAAGEMTGKVNDQRTPVQTPSPCTKPNVMMALKPCERMQGYGSLGDQSKKLMSRRFFTISLLPAQLAALAGCPPPSASTSCAPPPSCHCPCPV